MIVILSTNIDLIHPQYSLRVFFHRASSSHVFSCPNDSVFPADQKSMTVAFCGHIVTRLTAIQGLVKNEVKHMVISFS